MGKKWGSYPTVYGFKLEVLQRMETSTDSAYYKEVDKKHGNFLSVKVYLGE
jgi:hypothetical protein